jgi:hypothetical protein
LIRGAVAALTGGAVVRSQPGVAGATRGCEDWHRGDQPRRQGPGARDARSKDRTSRAADENVDESNIRPRVIHRYVEDSTLDAGA